MSTNIIIASTLVTGVVCYFLFRKTYNSYEQNEGQSHEGNNHHLTGAFARAKKVATHAE